MADNTKPVVGEFCWNELMTPDTKKAQTFYEELFGWTSVDHDMGGKTYTVFMRGDKSLGGMLQTPSDKAMIPPHWMSYISVEDIEKALEKARSLGGIIVVPKTLVGGMGCFGVIQDPTGAHVALWQSL